MVGDVGLWGLVTGPVEVISEDPDHPNQVFGWGNLGNCRGPNWSKTIKIPTNNPYVLLWIDATSNHEGLHIDGTRQIPCIAVRILAKKLFENEQFRGTVIEPTGNGNIVFIDIRRIVTMCETMKEFCRTLLKRVYHETGIPMDFPDACDVKLMWNDVDCYWQRDYIEEKLNMPGQFYDEVPGSKEYVKLHKLDRGSDWLVKEGAPLGKCYPRHDSPRGLTFADGTPIPGITPVDKAFASVARNSQDILNFDKEHPCKGVPRNLDMARSNLKATAQNEIAIERQNNDYVRNLQFQQARRSPKIDNTRTVSEQAHKLPGNEPQNIGTFVQTFTLPDSHEWFDSQQKIILEHCPTAWIKNLGN